MLRVLCLLVLAGVCQAGDAVTTPLPQDIAARLAARAAEARKESSRFGSHVLRAYLLYAEACKLDPLNANYRENRDELAPVAKLLQSQDLETADISADIKAGTEEATPGSDASVAVRLAEKGERARKSGQPVRAYLLYAAAAAKYPDNTSYRETRNTLAPVASLLLSTDPEKTDISADEKAAQLESLSGKDPAIEAVVGADWEKEGSLLGLPHVTARPEHHDFNLRGDVATLIQQVSSVYGVKALLDPDLPKTANISFQVSDVDFRSALEQLTAATGTFVFPVSTQVVYFAGDTEQKRNELEPNVVLAISLPESINDKDMIEAANAVRSVLNLRSFGWDSANHTVLVRDRFTRAHLAKSLLESVLLPRAQLTLELQFVTLDTDVSYHYGFSPQTTYQFLNLSKLAHFQTTLEAINNATNFFALGAGPALFGLGITSGKLFASYSNSFAKVTYNTDVVVMDGQTANLHVGEKYPIPTSLYGGASQTSGGSLYNPIGTVTQEDLGLVLKVTPHINGDGAVAMEIDAEYKALGTEVLNTVPSVSVRKFTGSVMLREGEWAILAGMDQNSKSKTRTGLAGLSDIPGLNQLLAENTRDNSTSETLVVLKPVITRLPMSAAISPQFLAGPVRGVRVLL
jgi:type II secretory pathway component GspD/PulD (secretin)